MWHAPDVREVTAQQNARTETTDASSARVLYEPAVTSWLVQFGQRTALTGISV
jgi:hypothetical protein